MDKTKAFFNYVAANAKFPEMNMEQIVKSAEVFIEAKKELDQPTSEKPDHEAQQLLCEGLIRTIWAYLSLIATTHFSEHPFGKVHQAVSKLQSLKPVTHNKVDEAAGKQYK